MIVEIGADIRGDHFDILDDLIAPPDARHLVPHERAEFVYLLLEVVDRHRVTPPPLFVAGAGIHCLPRIHRAGVSLPWVGLPHFHWYPSP
jgi:hypothetical protein